MAVIHTVGSAGDDRADHFDDPDDCDSNTLEYPEQNDPSADELHQLEAKSIAAAAAVAAWAAPLRFPLAHCSRTFAHTCIVRIDAFFPRPG